MTRLRIYWATTLFVAATALVAGTMDILHAPPLYDIVLRLGYPPHFATLLGVWKILGALALLAPRRPLLKEWAYAGMLIDYSAAVIAHVAAGDDVGAIIAPLFTMVLLAASWQLRPASRRLPQARFSLAA